VIGRNKYDVTQKKNCRRVIHFEAKYDYALKLGVVLVKWRQRCWIFCCFNYQASHSLYTGIWDRSLDEASVLVY